MSLFTNSSRQLRRITEQSISILKVSQNANTIQHLSFLPSKSKTYHGQYEKYTSIKTKHLYLVSSWASLWYLQRTTDWYDSQAFILNKLQIVRLLPDEGTFHFRQKNTFQSTRKVKTQKTIMCSSWSKRHFSPSNLLFLEKL